MHPSLGPTSILLNVGQPRLGCCVPAIADELYVAMTMERAQQYDEDTPQDLSLAVSIALHSFYVAMIRDMGGM